jgi:hypothetical protein
MLRVPSPVKSTVVALALAGAGAGTAQAVPLDNAAAAKCPRGYFCIYENVNFGGAHLNMTKCKTHILQSYRFKDQHGRWDRWREEASSWINNQTGGVAATLTSAEGRTLRAPIGRDKHMGRWHDQAVAVKPC